MAVTPETMLGRGHPRFRDKRRISHKSRIRLPGFPRRPTKPAIYDQHTTSTCLPILSLLAPSLDRVRRVTGGW